jgi:hypothetical protein
VKRFAKPYLSRKKLSFQLRWEAYDRRIMVQAGLGRKQDFISKIIRTKRAEECGSSCRTPG